MKHPMKISRHYTKPGLRRWLKTFTARQMRRAARRDVCAPTRAPMRDYTL